MSSAAVRAGDILTLTIEKLVHGGQGFSHAGSRACFVSNAIPGETAVVRIEQVHRQYLSGTAERILVAAASRVVPQCAAVTACGGCPWQHIAYEQQLVWKAGIVRESIMRIAGIRNLTIPPPLPSAEPFHYRTRATLQIVGGEIGYFKKATNDLVPVDDCPVLARPLNHAIAACRRAFSGTRSGLLRAGRLHLLLIRRTGTVLVLAGRVGGRFQKYKLADRTDALAAFHGDAIEEVDGLLFRRDTENFYQINDRQNRTLVRLVLQYTAPAPGDDILELYCGSGNFSLFLARAGARVTGIEARATAVAEARENAALNTITSCRFVCADVARLDPALFGKRYRTVLLNPPRSGCPARVRGQVAAARPERIVYVSCNPSTLGRDIKDFCTRGYALESIQPVDLFPQTWHVETVVKLCRA